MSREGKPEDDFFARWSRRKRAPEEAVPEEVVPEEAAPAQPEREKTDAEFLEERGLPDPDTLGPGDDFKAFMAKDIPARLRTRALRKLWLTNPALANLDELVDYGDDFTDAATVIENLQTVYQVGKGMVRDILEDEEEAPEEPADDVVADAEEADGAEARAVTEEEPTREPDAVSPATAAPSDGMPPEGTPPENTPPAEHVQVADETSISSGGRAAPQTISRKRMRFGFAESSSVKDVS